MLHHNITTISLPLLIGLVSSFTILGMESQPVSKYPQLQLELKKTAKTFPVIKGEIYIKEKTSSWTALNDVHFTYGQERERINNTGIEVSIYDPCIPVTVKVNDINWSRENITIQNPENEIISLKNFPLSIPAKHLWNLTTGSLLNLTVHGYPVTLVCKKNPLINDKEFHQQFEKKMNKLYTKPGSGIAATPEDELIPAQIIIQTVLSETITHDAQGGTTRTRKCSYAFGKNGCPDEQHLAKLVASEKIKPYNNSFYQLAMKQQYGSKLGISVKNQKAQTEFLQTSNDQNYTCSIQ